MTQLYEFAVGGRVGPMLMTFVPELELVAASPSTVLTGNVPGPEGLLRILNVLDANGLAIVDVRLTPEHGPAR